MPAVGDRFPSLTDFQESLNEFALINDYRYKFRAPTDKRKDCRAFCSRAGKPETKTVVVCDVSGSAAVTRVTATKTVTAIIKEVTRGICVGSTQWNVYVMMSEFPELMLYTHVCTRSSASSLLQF